MTMSAERLWVSGDLASAVQRPDDVRDPTEDQVHRDLHFPFRKQEHLDEGQESRWVPMVRPN